MGNVIPLGKETKQNKNKDQLHASPRILGKTGELWIRGSS